MIYIRQSKEPSSLTAYKKDKSASYESFSQAKGKGDVQVSLLKEQGYLCAYCMKRINIDSVRIEHQTPQSNTIEGKKLGLSYKNMLGVCQGIINLTSDDKLNIHCEANRGNTSLKVNPKDQTIIKAIKYSVNGEIFSDDEQINVDLDETLNLNIQTLKRNRKNIREGITSALDIKSKNKNAEWSKSFIEKELDKWKSPDIVDNEKKLKEYCGIAIYVLQKRLDRA